MTLQELQEKRTKLGAQIRQMADKFNAGGKKWADAGEAENWRKLNADYDGTKQEMAQIQAADEVDSRMRMTSEDDERSTNPDRKPGMDDTDRDERFDGSRDRERRGSRAERREQRRESRHQATNEETRQTAFRGWGRSGVTDVSRDEREAMRACGMNPGRRSFEIAVPDSQWIGDLQRTYRSGNQSTAHERCRESAHLRDSLNAWYERRTLSAITANAGGILVPASFIRQLEINKLAFGGMLQVATIQRTTSGELMTMPTADDTTNTGARIGESATIGTTSVDPSFGAVQWTAHKYYSKPVLVPHEFLEDSAFDLPGFLSQALPMRIARKQNTDFTTGIGPGPKGIMTCAASGRTATNAASITFDDIIYLEHSIDPAYRDGAEFMCHDNTVLAMRLIKDSNNRYIWTYGVQTNTPDMLNGKRLTVNQDMDSTIASGKKSLLYGQLSKYIIRQAGQSRFYRLQERYRDNDQDGFVMFERADGNLLHAGTVPVKYILHP